MKALHYIAFILLVIGGLNWGLVGIGNWNLVTIIFGTGMLAKIIYILVGLSAVYEVLTHKKNCKVCGGEAMPKPMM